MKIIAHVVPTVPRFAFAKVLWTSGKAYVSVEDTNFFVVEVLACEVIFQLQAYICYSKFHQAAIHLSNKIQYAIHFYFSHEQSIRSCGFEGLPRNQVNNSSQLHYLSY